MHSLESQGGAAVYDNGRSAPLSHTPDRVLAVTPPTDRVRWGPILAGLFTALTTGLVLSLAALAFGLNQFDPSSTARSFGIGAGIIGALIWLVAFGVGGYVAARTAAFAGRSNGIFNGLMVSLVGIPLLLWGLSSVVGGLLGTAGSIAGTAAQVAAPAAGQAADSPAVQAAAQDTAQQAQDAAQQLEQVTPEQVADTARTTALGALLPLVLGLAAAGAGGALGARTPDDDDIAVQA